LIDWFGRRQVTISHDLYIYRQLDIDLSINQRILTKYGEHLYLDLGLICENRTLLFPKPEPLVLQPGAFLKRHNFLIRARNHTFHIYLFWSSRRGLHHEGFKPSVWVHHLVVWSTYMFLEWNSTKLSEKHVHDLKNMPAWSNLWNI
jgi:hypothetical protein